MTEPQIDIKGNVILSVSSELLNTMLKDHTLSTDECQVNIFCATDNYTDRGASYQYSDEIASIESMIRQM